MKSLKLAVMVLATVAVAGLAHADYAWEQTGGIKGTVGGDIRIRLEHWDRDVLPDWSLMGGEMGPAVQYLRVRTRVWGTAEFTPDITGYIRLTNRVQHFSSHFLDPNNQTRSFRGARSGNTWSFPDEVIIDNLYLNVANIMDSNWSVRVGRQDIMLGKGMVLLEGTPYDQGRGISFDGVVATYETEEDTLKLLALYNDYRDKLTPINDRKRQLRRGDTTVLGAYWTHRFSSEFNTDLYYLNVDFDDPNAVIGNNARINVVGARAFGDISEQIAYSVEGAQQWGDAGTDIVGVARAQKLSGRMADARLTLKACEGTTMNPVLTLQYTYMSGDEFDSIGASGDRNEGWHPLFAEYPIWGDDLLPIRFNGNWTNLNQWRAQLGLQLHEKVKLTTAYAWLYADALGAPNNTGGGRNIGQQISAFLNYKATDQLSFAVEAAQLFPGNFYQDGHTAEWVRLEAVYRF